MNINWIEDIYLNAETCTSPEPGPPFTYEVLEEAIALLNAHEKEHRKEICMYMWLSPLIEIFEPPLNLSYRVSL